MNLFDIVIVIGVLVIIGFFAGLLRLIVSGLIVLIKIVVLIIRGIFAVLFWLVSRLTGND